MAFFGIEKFNLNDFWEQTPTKLKYMLIVAIFTIAIYFLFSRTISNAQIKELDQIEQTIETTYDLIERFEEFRSDQYVYNAQILLYLDNLYKLIEELNQNINRKFEILLLSGGSNTTDIIDKLMLLNESFEKLQEAYTPEEFEKFEKDVKDYESLLKLSKQVPSDSLQFLLDLNK